jgi:hypothetical protein
MNQGLQAFLRVLEALGLPHLAVGSVASSVHGLPRFTNDVDLLVGILPADVDVVATSLGADFYMDPNEARKSIRLGRAFNVLHLQSASKIDVFPVGSVEFHHSEMNRATLRDWTVPGCLGIRLPVASAEDTVLYKMSWYKAGGQVSDRQWTDLLGVATRNDLDWKYIGHWAPRLGVEDLLQRLRSEIA